MMWDRINLMLPTYGRSTTYLPRFIGTAMEMSRPERCQFTFCVNDKDTATREYLSKYAFGDFQMRIVMESLPSPNLAKYFNAMYDVSLALDPEGTVVSMLGDDMEFRTPDWDRIVLETINAYAGVGVFWCNDDFIAREGCPVNLFVTKKMVAATAQPFMSELFAGDMIDYVWGKVGKYTRTSHYLPNVHIWHNHNTGKPKELWDQTFRRLVPAQQQGHAVGKGKAKEIAEAIAATLKAKGFIGDSIC